VYHSTTAFNTVAVGYSVLGPRNLNPETPTKFPPTCSENPTSSC